MQVAGQEKGASILEFTPIFHDTLVPETPIPYSMTERVYHHHFSNRDQRITHTSSLLCAVLEWRGGTNKCSNGSAGEKTAHREITSLEQP